MNYLLVTCIALFLASSVVADDMPKFCTGNATKCMLAGANVTCVEPTSKDSGCVKDVADGKADLALISANDLVKNAEKLKMVYGQKLNSLEKFVFYYGLAVVKKDTTFSLKTLKGVDSCHTGAGRTVGWNIPIGYLLFTEQMTFTDNQWKSTSDFFNKSCVPGIASKTTTDAVKKDLCSLCNMNCTSTDKYAGYEGAFKCMADGSNDRVGFVKQTTADLVLQDAKYGTKTDYRLLCKDGTKKGLDEYKDCNIDKRPAPAIVTKVDTTDARIKHCQSLLEAAGVASLRRGGLVSNYDTLYAESLEKYTGSVKKYVGSYGDHYNALNGPMKPTPTSKAAQSIITSFALLTSAVFALLFLA